MLSWPLQRKNPATPPHMLFPPIHFFVVVQQHTSLPPAFSQKGITVHSYISTEPSFKRHFFEYILNSSSIYWESHFTVNETHLQRHYLYLSFGSCSKFTAHFACRSGTPLELYFWCLPAVKYSWSTCSFESKLEASLLAQSLSLSLSFPLSHTHLVLLCRSSV